MNRSCKHWWKVIAASLLLAFPAVGTIDKDADDMSDIWESHYGFSTTGSATSDEDPGADPDGDGWTNLQESMGGTDPGSAEMPEGVLKTQIAQNPSLTGVFTVSWETTPGKYYTLWVSTELDVWTPVGTAMLGDGTPIEMAVSSSGSKLFWRTTAADQDSDGDGLSDFEEWLVGTDSHKTDTDGDGVSDAGEVEQGKSPTDPNDTPTADWFTLVGDKPMDVVKSETRLFTVKKGETRLFVLGTQSDEYPVYTGGPSIFNDTLEWQITPGSGTAITGDINVNDRDLEWALDGANNVTLNGLEPVHVEAVKVIQAPATSDLVVTVTLKGTNIGDGTLPSRLIVGVLPVKIVPDENMIGVIGDMIVSNKGAPGQRHFVTPKLTGEIPQPHANLTTKGLEAAWITPGDPNQLVEWTPGVGEAVPATPPASADPMKWRVKRDAAAKNEVKIRTIYKYGNEEAAKLNVWVVWSEGQKTSETPIQKTFGQVQNGDGTIGPAVVIKGGYVFKFTIQPGTIFSDVDHPDLSGSNTYNGSIIDPPGSGLLHLTLNADIKGGANSKWDITRRVRLKVLNPKLYPKAQLIKTAGTIWDNQPVAVDTPALFPGDPRIGNDDTDALYDEDNDPYVACTLPVVSHGIGEIASTDTPNSLIRNSTGSDGDTFENRLHFGEFTRLLIGANWFRTSDPFNWRAHYKFKRQSGEWTDDGSSISTDNNGF